MLLNSLTDGGISDRPGDMPDVFHTFFGIAGLSLLGTLHETGSLNVVRNSERVDGDNEREQEHSFRMIDPVYALPTDVVQKLGLKGQISAPKNCDAPNARLVQYDLYS